MFPCSSISLSRCVNSSRLFPFICHCQFADRAFRVVVDSYVTASEGTGIVHQAPAFGEDDHRVAIAHGIISPEEIPPCPIDDAGCYTQEVPDFIGEHVKVSRFYPVYWY